MTKKKPKPEESPDAGKKRYPSRDRIKYVGITVEEWDALEALGAAADRSVSYMARLAIREYLKARKPPG